MIPLKRDGILRVLAFLGLCALAIGLPLPVSAQSKATIHPNPGTLQVGAGQAENLDIVIENVGNLYGVEIRAHFDPSVVEIVSAQPAQTGVQLIPGSFVKPDFLVRNQADNKKGTLEYVLTQTNPTPPANGSGTLVTIQFRGKILGKTSPFVIDHVLFSDGHGKVIPVTPQNGQIAVVQPKPPTPTAVSVAAPAPMAMVITAEPKAQAQTQDSESEAAPLARSAAPFNVSLLDLALISVGGCGFLGAILVIGAAAFVLARGSKRPRVKPTPTHYQPPIWR